jgi:hypothetical protein
MFSHEMKNGSATVVITDVDTVSSVVKSMSAPTAIRLRGLAVKRGELTPTSALASCLANR